MKLCDWVKRIIIWWYCSFFYGGVIEVELLKPTSN